MLPARHHADDVDWLNGELAKLERVLLILCGDEEAVFDWRQVDHGRIQFWVQLPNLRVHSDMPWAYFFGDGWNKDVPHELGPQLPEKDILCSFAGQVTNARRKRAVNGLTRARARIPGRLLRTEGFTQAAESLGLDLQVVTLPQPALRDLYEAPLALIRPDQIVATSSSPRWYSRRMTDTAVVGGWIRYSSATSRSRGAVMVIAFRGLSTEISIALRLMAAGR